MRTPRTKALRLGLPQDIRRRLKAARVAKGWSQAELGRRVRLSQAHVSGIETGRIVPRFDTLLDLARLLDHDLMLLPRPLASTVSYLERELERRAAGGGSDDPRPLYAVSDDEEPDDDDA
jgi:transcriptional regulator with XRE-family HTH domain